MSADPNYADLMIKKKLPENKLRCGLVSVNFVHELGDVFLIPQSQD